MHPVDSIAVSKVASAPLLPILSAPPLPISE